MGIKSLLAVLIVIFIGTEFSYASGKKVIAVVPITTNNYAYKQFASNLTEIVVTSFVKSRRFIVVDRTNFDQIYTEENMQKGESFINGEVVAQGKKMGASFIIAGNLANVSVSEAYSTSSTGGRTFLGYKARITFSLKIIDVITGEIKETESFTEKSGGISSFGVSLTTNAWPTKDEAINKCINVSSKTVSKFVDKYFPAMAKIFEITEQKRGKAKEVTITGGSELGLLKGQSLKVVEVSIVDIGGRTVERKKEIGWLKIESVDDENFSTCKVTKGDELIKQKFDSNVPLWVISGKK